MKIYFKEVTHRDYSRVGYDTVSITCSPFPYGTEEGHDATSVWYFIEVGDAYTQDEALKLAQRAVNKALAEEISLGEAMHLLTKKRRK